MKPDNLADNLQRNGEVHEWNRDVHERNINAYEKKCSKWNKNNQNKINSFKNNHFFSSNRRRNNQTERKQSKWKNTSRIIQNAILDRNQENCVATNQSKYLWHFSWLILLHEWFVIIRKGHSSIFIRLHWIKLNELKIKSNNSQEHFIISVACWGIFLFIIWYEIGIHWILLTTLLFFHEELKWTQQVSLHTT